MSARQSKRAIERQCQNDKDSRNIRHASHKRMMRRQRHVIRFNGFNVAHAEQRIAEQPRSAAVRGDSPQRMSNNRTLSANIPFADVGVLQLTVGHVEWNADEETRGYDTHLPGFTYVDHRGHKRPIPKRCKPFQW